MNAIENAHQDFVADADARAIYDAADKAANMAACQLRHLHYCSSDMDSEEIERRLGIARQSLVAALDSLDAADARRTAA